MQDNQKLIEVVSHFITPADTIEIKPLGAGHINDSFKVVNGNDEYVLQRINHSIFQNVDQLQNNIFRVTSHIRKNWKKQAKRISTAKC